MIGRLRQLEVPEIFNFIEENLTRFAQLNLSSCLIFYGGKESGKSTFLFQTSFFNMLTDQLSGANNASDGLINLMGAWIQVYEIGIDQRTRVEKKTNLLPYDDDHSSTNRLSASNSRGQMVHKANAGARPSDKETLIELQLTEEGRIQPVQLMFLLERAKLNSSNFDKLND